MPTLYLTADEKKIFDALPAQVKGEWTVEVETIAFSDSNEKMAIRLRNMKLSDPQLLGLKDKMATMKTQEELTAAMQSIDFSTVSQDDLIELYFAMGPDALTEMISGGIKAVKTADDLLGLVALTLIRHSLLISLSPASPQ